MSTAGSTSRPSRLDSAYRALLLLYPADFRRRYGVEMLRSLRDRRRDARYRGSMRGRLRLAAVIIEDLVRSVPREHLFAWRSRRGFDAAAGIRASRRAGAASEGSGPGSGRERSRSRASAVEMMVQDLRFAARTLLARPGFSLIVIVTLALGIGATTMIFSVLDGVVIRALPYPDSDRIVLLGSESGTFSLEFGPVSPFAFREWRARNPVFEAMTGSYYEAIDLTGQGDPERLQVAAVSPEYFTILGARPVIGRGILPADDTLDADRVVVIGHGLWQRRWGADRGVIGETITLGGQPWTIVGVMPPDFLPPEAIQHRVIEAWMPLSAAGVDWNDRDNFTLRVLAKLKPGVTVQTARQAMTTLAWALEGPVQTGGGDAEGQDRSVSMRLAGPGGASPADEAEDTAAPPPAEDRAAGGNIDEGAPTRPQRLSVAIGGGLVVTEMTSVRVAVASLKERTVGDSSSTLLTLSGAVAFLLLIACANVANLLLARSTDRAREVAVRAALGAGRARIVRQLLTESVLLAIIGGVVGAMLAVAGVKLFLGFNPGDLPRLQQVAVDPRVLAFAFLTSVGTGLLFGIVPALSLGRSDVGETLKEGSGLASQGATRARFRGLMVVGETALALVLLIGAGLMINSLVRLMSVDPGFEPENLAVMEIELGPAYAEPAAQSEFARRLVERVRAIPGIERVGVTSLMPFTGQYAMTSVEVEASLEGATDGMNWTGFHQVNADYFGALRTRFAMGRAFTRVEAVDDAAVVVVNETFARKYWGGTDVVGRRLRVGGPEDDAAWRTVVGVLADIKQFSLMGPTSPDVYIPFMGGAGGRRVHVAARLGVDAMTDRGGGDASGSLGS